MTLKGIWKGSGMTGDDLRRLAELAKLADLSDPVAWPSPEEGLRDIAILHDRVVGITDEEQRSRYVGVVDAAVTFLGGLIAPAGGGRGDISPAMAQLLAGGYRTDGGIGPVVARLKFLAGKNDISAMSEYVAGL